MDALYFYRHSEHDDLELRFSLRSLAAHAPWLNKIWIFGDRPGFLAENQTFAEHVPHEAMAELGPYRTPLTNFFIMLEASSQIPDLDDEYIWLCDDFICLDELSPESARSTRYIDDLRNVKNRGNGLWAESLWRTYDLLIRLGYPTYNFETHTPTYYRKHWIQNAFKDFRDFITEDRWYGMLGPTAVLNHAFLHDRMGLVHRGDEGRYVGFHGEQPTKEHVESACREKTFLNFDDDAFGPVLIEYLYKLLPDPCPAERTAAGGKLTIDGAQRSNIAVNNPKWEFPPPVISERDQLGNWLNDAGLLDHGVVIGDQYGHFAETLLRRWRCRRLDCIDAWVCRLDDAQHVDKNNFPQWKIDHAYNETRRRLGGFASRCHIRREVPADAASHYADRSLCLVYIDEQHYFQAVWDHLEIWSKKVRPGGILAGHDYLDGVLPSGNFEVKSAVDQWARERSLTVHCTGEDVWRSWIIQIP
ncbi:class I SAM-dependent methyltransferase [Novipirellula sp. SH528]|uniref:class I SAM-dependent methyltransferase n=1 Tax=Novipirellula sp. SH528 TaxID=3454466 RepID=UPI003F9FAE9B